MWVVLAMLPAASALAHDLKDPRVIIVVASKEKVELRINEMTSVAESEKLRRGFDGDHDGRLDDAEQSDLTSFLAVRATANLALEEAGVKLSMTTASRTLKSANARTDATDPLSVDVVLEATPAATGTAVALVLKDWRTDEHPVRVAVMASGVSLESASAGRLDMTRGLVTGIALSRSDALTLRYRR